MGADDARCNMREGSQMNDYRATLFVSQTLCGEIIHAREEDNRFFSQAVLVWFVFRT